MADISIDDVKHTAQLANIALTDDEATKMQAELGAILGYIQQLDTVDTTQVEPTYQVTGLENVMRDDILIDYGVSQDALLKNAPASQDGQIKVPKVL
jgi:aspartyl-tRNA(Asn)/glutamyl-tRNA(Gln) amidotransferase subunit C